jgi:hypothetical protein
MHLPHLASYPLFPNTFWIILLYIINYSDISYISSVEVYRICSIYINQWCMVNLSSSVSHMLQHILRKCTIDSSTHPTVLRCKSILIFSFHQVWPVHWHVLFIFAQQIKWRGYVKNFSPWINLSFLRSMKPFIWNHLLYDCTIVICFYMFSRHRWIIKDWVQILFQLCSRAMLFVCLGIGSFLG